MDRFPKIVAAALKYCVYIYSNPLTDEIFYVGKGQGDRVFSHLNDKNETEKVRYLADLKAKSLYPKI